MNQGLEREGFSIHPACFPPARVKQLRSLFDRHVGKAGAVNRRASLLQNSDLHELASCPELAAILSIPTAIPVRVLLFDKTERKNWPVAWHQDLTIAVHSQVSDLPGYGPWSVKGGIHHVQPPLELLERMTTLRIHLDDAGESNGALRVIPRTHLVGKMTRDEIAGRSRNTEKVCDCSAGDVLQMRPLLLHASNRAEKPMRRRVIHFEYCDPGLLHPYLEWAEAS